MTQNIEDSAGLEIDRRDFLAKVALGVGAFATAGRSNAVAADRQGVTAQDTGFPGLVTRQREPKNLEFPFQTLDTLIVPNDRFFVRGHFPIPMVDAGSWRLKVDGEVRQPLSLSYEEVRRLPSKTLTATIECAGNNRGFLVPKSKGVQWNLGGVGNAEWTGVPLATVLERAGIKDGAVEVILEGADSGALTGEPKTPGVIHYERSLPLKKANRPEVILAYQMNGKDLPTDHGFPLRAIVGGWYGMASVKWLKRITVTAEPFRGFWQTADYSYWKRDGGRPSMVPLNEIQVKSSIARPAMREVVRAGDDYRVFGAAWTGEAEVAKVEVSTDGGKTWDPARLLGDAVPYSWRFWEYDWPVPRQAGAYRVMARATDSRGRTQGDRHDTDRGGYMVNHVIPVEVEAR